MLPSRGVQAGQGQTNPHYAAFLECFNQGQYYQAHEVLESLWLKCRKSVQGDFFKGLIQVAGVFVHVQRGRAKPADAGCSCPRAQPLPPGANG